MSIHRRKLTDEDVGIEITHCGICHSDLHWIRNEWKDSVYPMVPGHEIIGRVSSIGSKVSKFKVGDKVGVGLYVDSCRKCDLCTNGQSQHCPECVFVFNAKYRKDDNNITMGGFSKYIVVDQNYINTIPVKMDIQSAAPLLCAGVTVFTPMRKQQIGPGCRFAVNGFGGLGHLATKLGVAMGADVTVLSHSSKKEDDARRLGVKDFVLTSKPSELRKLRQRFDCVLDTVTVKHNMDSIFNTIKINGKLILIGIPEHPISLQAQSLVMGSRSMVGSLIGSIEDAQNVIDFCAEKDIRPEIELIKMDYVNEAMERMLKSDVRYRFVIDMSSL
ncbi:hypothetical protein GJ496_004021 [Pomphorhynchus laevis]|nr:hypothetical protein GJ496_004021 [Pomphorhynchus laevis]